MRDGTAEPVSRDQILRRERGQGKIFIFCSVSDDYEHDWQPYYPVDSYSCYMWSILALLAICDDHVPHTHIHTQQLRRRAARPDCTRTYIIRKNPLLAVRITWNGGSRIGCYTRNWVFIFHAPSRRSLLLTLLIVILLGFLVYKARQGGSKRMRHRCEVTAFPATFLFSAYYLRKIIKKKGQWPKTGAPGAFLAKNGCT